MKKKTVKIKANYIEYCLGVNGWSNAHFCTNLMSRGRGWITEWKRGRNLPTPEETARMCELLHTAPEDILTDAEDVELVRGLLEQAEKNNAPAPIAEGERIDPTTARIIEIVRQLDPKVRESYLQQLESLLALQDAAQKRDSQN